MGARTRLRGRQRAAAGPRCGWAVADPGLVLRLVHRKKQHQERMAALRTNDFTKYLELAKDSKSSKIQRLMAEVLPGGRPAQPSSACCMR